MENNEIVMPDYDHCILGTISSILKYYNVETKHKTLESLDQRLAKGYRNVVLLILDGMGEHILNNLAPEGFFQNHKVDMVTSVYPSTTTAALTTYYSGRPPYETGWIAWSQYFKEYGRALDMLSHRESYLHEDIKNPLINVFDTVVKYTTVFEQIERSMPNVKAYEVMPKYSDRRSRRTVVADDIDELVEGVKMLCEHPGEKFIMAYSDNPDATLHKFGAYSDEAKEFILNAQRKIEEMCNSLGEDTIVVISADHGHRDIEKAYTLLDYPEILECLIMPPSLESRTVAFWVKEDMRRIFEDRFKSIFGNEFMLLTREEFLDKHFLGYGEKHPKIDEFIGNYIALSTSTSIIRLETFLAEGKKVKASTHCGLTKEEMEVPVIII